MNAPRVTLRGVMVAVVLLAVNLALLRAAWRADFELPLVVGGPFLALEVALGRAWWDRRPGRAFWVGYVLLGGLVTASLAWAVTGHAQSGMLLTGTYGVIRPPPATNRFWEWAIGLATNRLQALARWAFGGAAERLDIPLTFLVVYGPQFGAGALGGWIGRWVGRRVGRSPLDIPPGEAIA